MLTRSSPTKKAFPLTVTGVVIAADAIVENATKAVAVATALKLRMMNGEQIAILRMETSEDGKTKVAPNEWWSLSKGWDEMLENNNIREK